MLKLRSSETGWLAADLEQDKSWIRPLTGREIDAIETATQQALTAGRDCATVTAQDFGAPAIQAVMEEVRASMESPKGFIVLRGFPVQKYTVPQLRLMYLGMGRALGVPVSQSRQGDVIGDVKNFNSDIHKSNGRGYTSRQHLNFHTDSCDVVCLLVLKTAKAGGVSMICSSVAIYQEIARTRPDLLEVLCQPYHWSWQQQEAEGMTPHYQQPIFSAQDGYFASRYIRSHIENAPKFTGVPPLTAMQREALDLIDTLANDPRFMLSMHFQPGDFQFLNNHITYHSRTEFDDFDEPERRRHLLRMWIATPNSRPLNPALGTIYQDQRAGAVRGGFPSRVGTHVYETRGWDV